MSTHLHLDVGGRRATRRAQRRTRRVVRRLDATADERGVALLDVPHFEVLSDDHAALRYLAYAHANPVTAGMVNDPLAWPFSSHRDVLGFRFAPWFSPRAHASRA